MTQPSDGCYDICLLDIPAATQITQLFQHHAAHPWSMLLDSANSNHVNARYDIFVANPITTMLVKDLTCKITHANGTVETRLNDDPLMVIQQLLAAVLPQEMVSRSTTQSNSLPFKAGAMGYFAYDLGRRFESLPSQAVDEYDTPDMAVGIYTWSVIKDNNTGLFYLVSVQGYDAPLAKELEQHANKPVEQLRSFTLNTPWQNNMSKSQYLQKIDTIHDYLIAGDCYQVNLAQRFHADYSGSTWQAYIALRKANQAPFSAYLNLPDTCIVSISPERFLSVIEGQVETKPIKGTRPRYQDQDADQREINILLNSEKDRAENLMIVDLLRNDLSKTCQNHSITVPELFKIETFEAVHHLVSKVVGKLKADKSALDLLRGAFPGGSITGAPKIRAMQIIDELEPQRRNIYCGSIGYLSFNGDMDTSICIRTLLFENNRVFCWAGGGIVLDSNGPDEYQESLDKVSKILPVLAELGRSQ